MSPRRPDATLVKSTSKFHELMFHLMPRKTNLNFMHHMTLDLDNTFSFLDEVNKDRDEKITLFEVILTGLQRVAIVKPKVNRFIKGRRLWQRNELSINFVVKREKTEAGEEVNALIRFSPYETLETVS